MSSRITAPILDIKALKDTGEFEGYGSTFGGEPDSYGDVIAPGAYSDSLAVHRAKGTMPKLFWQHNADQPIGKWLGAAEDERGLLMRGKLNMDVQRGREAHALLKAGDRLTEREFEVWLKGLGFSNSQAERTARLHLKGQGAPADADNDGLAFLRALAG